METIINPTKQQVARMLREVLCPRYTDSEYDQYLEYQLYKHYIYSQNYNKKKGK